MKFLYLIARYPSLRKVAKRAVYGAIHSKKSAKTAQESVK